MSALITESWAWYAVTVTVTIARLMSRRMLFGSFRKLQVDDYLMMLAICTYTVLLAGVDILTYTNTNLINPDDHIVLTPEDVQERVFGSKMVIVVEQMQISTIWLVKACLLIMYSRLTTSLKQNHFVKFVAAYVVSGWVIMEILFFGVWCRPFWNYWQVPPDNIQCSAERNHLITNSIFNISSDIMIIALPMPVFLQSQLPLKKKAILCTVFAFGIFTILSAILNKYYSFSETFGTAWIFWYIREASTAIIVANLPFTWTLLQRLFSLRSFSGKSSGRGAGEGTSHRRSAYGNLASRTREQERRQRAKDGTELSITESQEQINQTGVPLKIYQKNEVHITTEDVESLSDRQSLSEVGHNGVGFVEDPSHPDAMHSHKHSLGESDLGSFTKVSRGL
ncbi:hypothetical protein BJ170DRAFT_679196 [Xylariales sp. AK1849]|nr:hypothetical protein BJ170DRAFT_679196 [Xylariales sp. AK1849]